MTQRALGALLLITALGLGGCGVKGDLTLPPAAPASEVAP